MASYLLLLLCSVSVVYSYQLELVSIVFRHGSRSPVDTYPNDPYKEGVWPQGFGQLTTEGMKQEYNLGSIFKKRYIDTGYMNNNYTRNQVYARSTDYDRTLMSAQCVLAGLYPLTNSSQEFIDKLLWQPIPVHSVIGQDILLRAASSCPYFDTLMETDESSTSYQTTVTNNHDLFKELSQYTGMSVNLSSIWTLQDTLFVQDYNNLTMPVWYTDQLKVKLQTLSDYTLSLRYNSYNKKIINGGVWANKVMNDMECKINNTLHDMKLYLYSAHDTTVSAMLSVFGLFNERQPLYSSAFIIELYSNNNNYYVKFLYHNETWSDSLIELTHPHCTDTQYCPFEYIQQYMSDYRLTEAQVTSLCQDYSVSSSIDKRVLGLSIGISVMGLLLIIIIIILSCVIIKQRRTVYYNMSNEEDTNGL